MHKICSLGLDKHAYVFSTTDHGAWQGTLYQRPLRADLAVPERCWRADVAPNPAIPPFKMMGWITRTLRQEASDSADYDFHTIARHDPFGVCGASSIATAGRSSATSIHPASSDLV